jgi:hypothetical protein
MPVSIPEKTLEHWSSQYLTYRYRTRAALWWPANGEDIGIGSLPPRPGKAVQLELKTTTVTGLQSQVVFVDLGQLWRYLQRPPGLRPFYAFPWPDWHGNLTAVASAEDREVTELGFSRSGTKWWFAHWMVILTADQVAGVLRNELAAHNSEDPCKKRLVRFGPYNKKTKRCDAEWGDDGRAADPLPVGWLDFWDEIDQCGRPGWPQLIRIPAQFLDGSGRGPYGREQIAAMLREVANMQDRVFDSEQLVTLQTDEDGNYGEPRSLADYGRRTDKDEQEEVDGVDDNRQIIFIEARALFGAR